MAYLYDSLIKEFGKREVARTEVPNFVSDNLKYQIRPYQEESFQRFILCYNEDFDDKPNKPFHLLYNMATGSGKTLIMAGLMLYLYEKGYRNFLFFVNSNNIIQKTKDNFLKPEASKYLFSNKIVVDGKQVLIKEVDNFEEADNENININFTTIQQLHIDLNNTKENSVTYEDFKAKKIVLIADEAHHLSSGTKSGNLFGSWEGTVEEILKQNYDNILLEFTATLDYDAREIVEKYQSKVIQKYDLAQFRIDKYSKEINLIRSLYDEQERIIQALILNLYRQELATSKDINLKPVVLFKAKKTIKESEQNKENFHKLIEDFSIEMVENIKKTSTVEIVQKAFDFFESKGLTANDITKRIKSNFKEENCISANNDKEAELNQIRLNTLEDENNPIRAVFAVQKLNEGWDVLNLFDIVRLYEGQNTGGSNTTIGKTTLSEAQLIGRGARYFPFKLEEGQDLFKRKFDDEPSNDLKVLEELYYHTKEDNRYISELKKALVESGIYEDEEKSIQLQLELKPEFKQTDFYKTGKVIYNKKVEKSYDNVKSFSDLGVSKKNIDFTLSSGIGMKSGVFEKDETEKKTGKVEQKDVKVSDIPKHIIRYALTQNPFYYFESLERYFPNIESLSNFIESKEYLSGLEITLNGTNKRLDEVSNLDFLLAIQKLLQTIESEIKSNLTEYEGSEYLNEYVHKIFSEKKTIKVYKDSERADGQFDVVSEPEWYVYNANYGTSEEKEFVKMFARRFEYLEKAFENIYLIRNEREIKIIDKLGRAFEPDFVLFCKQKTGKELTYQVFIEPKGKHLKAHDKWKEDFLKEIREDKKTIEIDSDKYLITGVPFYNNENENEFKETLENTLNDANA
ncbi:MAG: DEAD/DEAH box helicase family protein [Flavobacteriaceae bacterium]|nr:DEAD/DEAH box helicase family protein [Flavobacteriaceae bacterium]